MKIKVNLDRSRKDKDPSRYDGPSYVIVNRSFNELFCDLLDDLGEFTKNVSRKLISNWILKFLDAFWKESKACKDGTEVKQLADLCKARRNDLHSLVGELIDGKAAAFPGDFYLIVSDTAIAIPEFKHYYPNSFEGIINYFKEIDEVLSRLRLTRKPGFYIYLHKILFHIISSIQITEEEYNQNQEKIIQLLLLPVSLGQVFEHMNPDDKVMEEFGQTLLDQLRQEASVPSDDFWELFLEVEKDISSRKTKANIYVHELIDARLRFQDELDIPKYDDVDFYLTAKAATAQIEIKGRKIKLSSIFSSVFEIDPIKDADAVRAFDNLVGYHSGYIDIYDIPDNIEVITSLVITMMITNPGKYKPRGIHVGCNAIQDRCKYLHRLLKTILGMITSSCMEQHFKGVEFLKKVTAPSYREDHRNNVFVSDFSNATDTLDQTFQCMVIKVLTNETFSDYWKYISQLPKKFRHPLDSKLEDYKQMTGQPQGLLASFDAFSLAHIYLVCMLMKRFHMESVPLSETLAIVGDDSVISYPSEYEDHDKYQVTFYEFHSKLCEEVSLIKNDSKTGKSFFDSYGRFSSEILDFAKISIKDGVFMTPLPYGLASNYSSKKGNSDIQLFLWLSSKGLTYKGLMYRKIIEYYGNKPFQLIAVSAIISSGKIEFLKGFEDCELYNSIDSSIRGVAEYSFYSNLLKRTFLASILSESDSEILNNEHFFERSLDNLEKEFYEVHESFKEMISLLPAEHKYNRMLIKNMQLAEDIQTIIIERDVTEVTTLLGVLIDEKYSILFNDLITWKKAIDQAIIQDSPDIWQLFCCQEFESFRDLTDPIKEFQVKSMKKVSSDTTTILKASAKESFRILSKSSCLYDDYIGCIGNFTDKLLQLARV